MEELRPEIRAVFEKEQAAHPPAIGLRRDLIAVVAVQPRRTAKFQWVAVAAAGLIGLAVVAGLMSSRLAAHRAPAPATSPKASPVADYGPPPAGVPLLYVHDPNNPSWLIGYDWSGMPRATVKFTQPVAVTMAPDGSAFQSFSGKGGTIEDFDRLGNPIGELGYSMPVGSETWADDSQHLCSLSYDPEHLQWVLVTRVPGIAPKTVPVAIDPSIVRSGIIGMTVAACSIRNDRAILDRTPPGIPANIWVVRVSDGKILSHHSYGTGLMANVVASADAAYIAETPGVGADVAWRAAGARILRVSDWTLVGTARVANVWGFSGDDSLLLADQLQADSGSLVVVVDWRSGSVLWHDEGSATLGGFVAQPGGRAFALVYTTSGAVSPGIPDLLATILIVNGDGSAIKFPRLYGPTW